MRLNATGNRRRTAMGNHDISLGGSICRLSDFALLVSIRPASIGITLRPTSPFWRPPRLRHEQRPARFGSRASAKLPRCSRSVTPAPTITRRRRLLARRQSPRRRHRRCRYRSHRHPDEPREYRAWCPQDSRSRSSARSARGDHSINIPCINAFDGEGRSTLPRSMPISTSSMSATASASDTAT